MRLIIFDARVKVFLIQKTLPLVRRTVNQVEAGATALAPHGSHMHGSGDPVAGVTLSASIFQEIKTTGDTISGYVGSRKDYAATAHQGSGSHAIYAKGKMLKFAWERGSLLVKHRSKGRRGQTTFFFMKVHHPGNKRPVRYLTTPLHLYGRANGFRTTSLPVSRTRLP